MTSERDKLISELVLKALDGDLDSLNAVEDRVLRAKAKAALVKAKKDPKAYKAQFLAVESSTEKSGQKELTEAEKKISELVLKALDGDLDSLNAVEDRVLRSKAKAALMKAKKDPEAYKAQFLAVESSTEKLGQKKLTESEKKISELVLKALDGDLDSLNAVEDRVLRSKAKAALVKAKKDPSGYKAQFLTSASTDLNPIIEAKKTVAKIETLNSKIKKLSMISFPGIILNDDVELFLQVSPVNWYSFAGWLKSEPSLAFDSLQCQTGFDVGDEHLEARYNLHSMSHDHYTEIRIRVSRKEPCIPSVEKVWRIADWFERETYDMLGIDFSGHRDLRRILLPEDWEGWPLRKDYQVQETYHGIVIPKMKEGWE